MLMLGLGDLQDPDPTNYVTKKNKHNAIKIAETKAFHAQLTRTS